MKPLRIALMLLQLSVSALLLWLLLQQIPLDTLAQSWSQLSITFIIPALIFFILSILMTSWNWYYILRRLGVIVPFPRVLGATLSGLFYSMVIPSSASADVARLVRLRQSERQGKKIALSVLVDRMTGLMVFGLVLLASLPFYLDLLPFNPLKELDRGLIWVGFGLAGLMIAYLIYRRFPRFFHPYIETVMQLRSEWTVLVVAMLVSIGVHLLVAAMLWVLCLPFWPDASLFFCLLIVELLNIAELVPISVAGLGVRETLYVVMLGAFGVAQSEALVVSLMQFALILLVSLAGAAYELYFAVRPVLRGEAKLEAQVTPDVE
jgi:glycosyltransferase 2 family protein